MGSRLSLPKLVHLVSKVGNIGDTTGDRGQIRRCANQSQH